MRLLALLLVVIDCSATPQDAPCAGCHKAQSDKFYGHAGQGGSSMAKALYTVAEADILIKNPKLAFQLGKYSYRIERRGNESIYSITEGKDKFELALRFAFGQGAAGQTYVFEYKGQLYESRVSFYKELGGLDLTLEIPRGEPRNLLEAAGREMTPKDVTSCFACHTTNSIEKGLVNFNTIQPGVGCQSCHTNAGTHLEAIQSGNLKAAAMPKLSKWSPEQQSDACGRCHRTWSDIAANGPRGINNVRFQPYRLANSKCYDSEDRRIGCTGCHDVHAPLEKNLAAYDTKCTACHTTTGSAKKTCPKAQSNCASCHMPRFEIPGSHHQFTDHMIRIVRKNETYPN